MKSSGILDNRKFIKNLIKDVKFITNFDVKKVINTKDQLKLLIDDKGNSLKAKTVIWANGYEMKIYAHPSIQFWTSNLFKRK